MIKILKKMENMIKISKIVPYKELNIANKTRNSHPFFKRVRVYLAIIQFNKLVNSAYPSVNPVFFSMLMGKTEHHFPT